MKKFEKQLLSFLFLLLVIWLQPSNAQLNAFIPCVDADGNASICVGEIPESDIQQPDYTRVPGERSCGSGSSSSTFSWRQNGNDEVPGIYWAFLKIHCKDNRSIVVWTDLERGFLSRSAGNPFREKCGRAYSAVPREEDWGIGGEIENDPCISYDFSLLKSGEGKGDINGIEFNLSDGDVFLISTAGGEVTIRQVDYDLTLVSTEDIQLLARRYPEIRAFFEEQAL